MKANCEAGETETNAHIGHAYLPTYVWRPTHPVASLFSASFSSIIIIYILFTVNAHRFLHPYAKETESNHFTMLHPFRMCMWLLLNCIVGGKSPSFLLLCRLPVVLATLTFFLAWIIFSALSLSLSFIRFMLVSLSFTCCRLTSFDDEFISYTKWFQAERSMCIWSIPESERWKFSVVYSIIFVTLSKVFRFVDEHNTNAVYCHLHQSGNHCTEFWWCICHSQKHRNRSHFALPKQSKGWK